MQRPLQILSVSLVFMASSMLLLSLPLPLALPTLWLVHTDVDGPMPRTATGMEYLLKLGGTLDQ